MIDQIAEFFQRFGIARFGLQGFQGLFEHFFAVFGDFVFTQQFLGFVLYGFAHFAGLLLSVLFDQFQQLTHFIGGNILGFGQQAIEHFFCEGAFVGSEEILDHATLA